MNSLLQAEILQTYLTDKDLVVVLMCKLAQSICHVGDPVPQMVHSIFTANTGDQRKETRDKSKTNKQKTKETSRGAGFGPN